MRSLLSCAALVGLLILTTGAFATGELDTVAPQGARDDVVESDTVRYATGFTIDRYQSFTVLTVVRPWQFSTEEDVLTYVLHPRGSEQPAGFPDAAFIETPVESIVTMSTTFLTHLEQLGELNALDGHDALAWVYSPAVQELAGQGEIAEVGSGAMVDVELLVSMNPDAILLNSYGGEWDAQPVLDEAGLPTVVLGDWVETTPLGRAEWLLFTAALFDKLDVAERRIDEIAVEYERLRELAASADSQPTVLINAPYQGTWSAAGGESYAAQFIRDAGAEYVWSDDESTGALFLDFEIVYDEAGDAEYWINPGAWSSLEQGAAEDQRFESFAAFKAGKVYNNNARVSEGGGVDYFESGASNPDVVLADLISIFHPELLPDHEPYYYQQLR